jgi:RHH-type proline utilization regulon transcriptional repressor/proline dehydrogenase/delta 1-pyrroline-5-carboxylate dehydrogenase
MSHLVTDDLSTAANEAIERRTQAIGRHLWDNLRESKPGIWQRRWWDDRIMAWSMQDESLKVQLFRFVDVLPMLRSSDAVTEHLHEYLETVRDRLPAPLRVALGVARRVPLTRGAVARAARLSAADFARRFIAGEDVRQVLSAAREQRDLRRGFTLDILGEAVISEQEADQHFRAYLELLEAITPQVIAWPDDPLLDADDHGPIPRVNLSIKLSAMDSQFDAIDPAGTLERVGRRLRELLRTAQRLGAFINVDMESYDKKALTLHVFRTILCEPEFRDWPDVGIVIQCYLRDSGRDLVALREWAESRGTPVWVRLVKGAYWDYETIRAKANGWPIPVYQKKWQSDANFEQQTRFVMQNARYLRPALGSHNLRSLAHGIAVAEHLGLAKNGFEIQMLYGMADAQKQALVDLGHRLRIYMPYGDLIPGMAYLVRRLLENTSNDSFLRAGLEEVPAEELLKSPQEVFRVPGSELRLEDQVTGDPRSNSQLETRTLQSPQLEAAMSQPQPFANQPPVDFSLEENRRAMQAALAKVKQRLPRDCPLVIGGQTVETSEKQESLDPSNRRQVVGRFSMAGQEHVQQAVAAAKSALPDWSGLGVQGRAEYLRSAAEAMRERLFELAAWIVYETGKPWREATADVDEAIDFCQFYAAEGIKLQAGGGVDVPGEENRFEYLPRGVTAVIAPWNFPLAILTGMSTAALITGNTVILKPAEQSSAVGSLLMEIFDSVDLPPGALNYLPGQGETVGAALVAHPDVAIIAFTGSRSVGMSINATAAEVSRRGTSQVKRVIAEMGGKNAIIVAADADLDEAVTGVARSAFGYAGQKCSACSRAVVVADVYDQFLARLIEATRSLKVGPTEEPATIIGPVIDDESLERIQRYIEIGKQEGTLALAVDVGPLAPKGCFVGPHIFADVPSAARIAQEEIFGPVLAVIKAADLSEALRIANGTDYALTGGVFSRSPAALDRCRREFLVGNLYLNRGITGALVGRQPFGGFKMSGIGSKAGGGDYLLQFVLPRTITEHTVRRGFAPPEGE